MIPITQFKNGDGPTALLTGANHGDEYEGPIALFNLARRNNISNISGRVIIVPAMNFPAFQSCDRVSPIDGINMNRTYPGKPDGTVTQIIADYFSRILLPMTDIALDIHSGGKTLDCLPFAASHALDNKKQEEVCEAAAKAFGAPYLLKMLELDSGGMYDSQVESMGKTFVTTELGGGGTSTPYTVEIAKRGVDNLLIHAGIMSGKSMPSPTPTVSLNMPDDRSFVCCEHRGLVEPVVSLGDTVHTGDLLAIIHNTDRTAAEPVEYFAKRDGMVIIKHSPSIINMGDNLFVIAAIV
jgi:N-alpha-acetyl-L-2,4-diaminobutyrate deacetylase